MDLVNYHKGEIGQVYLAKLTDPSVIIHISSLTLKVLPMDNRSSMQILGYLTELLQCCHKVLKLAE